jgi:hypothetical protein
MGFKELEAICKAVLNRKDLDLKDKEFWSQRLAWVEKQKKRDAD